MNLQKLFRFAVVSLGSVAGLFLTAAVIWPPASRFLKHAGPVTLVVASPDGKTLASVSDVDRTIRLLDIATRKELATLRGQPGESIWVRFSPDGKTLASKGLEGGTIRLLDLAAGEERDSCSGLLGSLKPMAFSSDCTTLAALDDNTIQLWDMAAGELRSTLHGHTNSVVAVEFSPDGKTVASASEDHTVKLWDVASGRERATHKGRDSGPSGVAFSPDGKTLLLWNNGCSQTIKLWDVASGTERSFEVPEWLVYLSGNSVVCVAFSSDSSTLALGTFEEMIGIWDISSGKNTAVFGREYPPHLPPMNRVLSGLHLSSGPNLCQLCFAPDGRLMAFGTDHKTVKMWQVPTVLSGRK